MLSKLFEKYHIPLAYSLIFAFVLTLTNWFKLISMLTGFTVVIPSLSMLALFFVEYPPLIIVGISTLITSALIYKKATLGSLFAICLCLLFNVICWRYFTVLTVLTNTLWNVTKPTNEPLGPLWQTLEFWLLAFNFLLNSGIILLSLYAIIKKQKAGNRLSVEAL